MSQTEFSGLETNSFAFVLRLYAVHLRSKEASALLGNSEITHDSTETDLQI